MKKPKVKRSLKQKWHSERRFMLLGTLKSCWKKLESLSNLDSTLPSEENFFKTIAEELKLFSNNVHTRGQESWEKYRGKNG